MRSEFLFFPPDNGKLAGRFIKWRTCYIGVGSLHDESCFLKLFSQGLETEILQPIEELSRGSLISDSSPPTLCRWNDDWKLILRLPTNSTHPPARSAGGWVMNGGDFHFS